MNEIKLLTVAIPAYKRPEHLDKCLESIFRAIGERNVDVLVMDDSMDQTNDAVCRKYKHLRHLKNKKNLGIDKNICACIENSDSKYVWLIGEDDLMRASGFSDVYRVLDGNTSYPFVFVNYSYITSDQKKILRNKSVDLPTGEMEFKEFFEKYLWSAGFIGGCVINKNDFTETEYKSYIGTYYAHVGGISLASQGKKIFTISRPVVGNRVGNASTFTWSDDSFGVFQGWRLLLKSLKNEFGDVSYVNAYTSHKVAHGYLGYKFLINKKADGILDDLAVNKLVEGDVSPDEISRIYIVNRYIPQIFCLYLRKAYEKFRRGQIEDFVVST